VKAIGGGIFYVFVFVFVKVEVVVVAFDFFEEASEFYACLLGADGFGIGFDAGWTVDVGDVRRLRRSSLRAFILHSGWT